MERNLNYYLDLPYTRELIPEPEGGWFVRIKELSGCMSQGDTPEEAMAMIEDAMQGWLEVALAHGQTIPEPRLDEDYSGKFVVRVPKSMHRKLVEQADQDGVSLNQWILEALAESLGYAKYKKDELIFNNKIEYKNFADVQRSFDSIKNFLTKSSKKLIDIRNQMIMEKPGGGEYSTEDPEAEH